MIQNRIVVTVECQ